MGASRHALTLEAIDAERCTRSLARFAQRAWELHHPGRKLLWSWHMDAICDHLEAATRGEEWARQLLISVPPGHTKSLLTSVYWPAWEWITSPGLQSISVSASDKLALRDAVRQWEVCSSQWYRETFRPKWSWNPMQNAKGFYWNSASGYRLSLATGQRVVGHRGDRIRVDDPLDPTKAITGGAEMDAVWVYFRDSLRERRSNLDTAMVVVMQRLHEGDLVGRLLEEGGWTYLCLPAKYDPDRHCTTPIFSDPRTEPGEPLCPGRFPQSELDKIEARTPNTFRRQHQQDVGGSAGGTFRREWFRYWTPGTLPPGFDLIIVSVDTNWRRTSTDPVACSRFGVRGSEIYLLNAWAERLSLHHAIAKIHREATELGEVANYVLVEETCNGPAIIEALTGRVPGLTAIRSPKDSKVARAEVAADAAASGRILIPDPLRYEWVDAWLSQVLGFPDAAHDDLVDSFSQFVCWYARAAALPLVLSLGGH